MLLYNKEMSLFKSTHYLRISNRGNAVETIVENNRFSVNLPAALRSLGRSRISVHDALLNFQSQSLITGVIETFIISRYQLINRSTLKHMPRVISREKLFKSSARSLQIKPIQKIEVDQIHLLNSIAIVYQNE